MPEITATYRANLSLGNRDAVIVKTASIDNGDTLKTGLSAIEHVSFIGDASGKTGGCTVSGGTITFALSASFGVTSILATGFK